MYIHPLEFDGVISKIAKKITTTSPSTSLCIHNLLESNGITSRIEKNKLKEKLTCICLLKFDSTRSKIAGEDKHYQVRAYDLKLRKIATTRFKHKRGVKI